ncbi:MULTISPECIES: DUF4382 domain-containing protein [Haloarcula]|uniref:DUF4382 domain-containing protein n=1 Tax=Haloarcula TaxID=2237 RepID=UPI0023EADAC5|nr:DUF4382 domain-containing protein [Halomicroarcula sp. XH51]
MQRRDFLRTAGFVAGSGALAGCPGRNGETGLLVTRFRDASDAVADFDSCVVTVSELRVLPAAAATETEEHEGAELLFSIEDASVDLVEVADDGTAFAFEQELMTGQYVYLKLVVARIDAALTDGREAMVTTPDDGPLRFGAPFEIGTGDATILTAGLRPVQRGAATSYVLRPAPSQTTVTYE